MNWELLGRTVVTSIVFSVVGLAMFALAFRVLQAILPFSIKKEIEEDQNVALGVMIGAVMLGLALIIAAAIHG
jgi:uncharacterized membrane protein YjfL (UPF0719 family)